jgi:hypothetical protein
MAGTDLYQDGESACGPLSGVVGSAIWEVQSVEYFIGG